MLKKIESLRQRPKHVRNAYAFWIALSITLLIAFLWSTTLPAKFSNTNATSTAALNEEQGSSFFHTLGELKESVIATFANMRTTTQYVREAKPEEEVDPNVLDLKKIYEESLKNTKTATATSESAATSTAPSE